MRYLIILLCTILIISCNAQNDSDKTTAWLPEGYVLALQLKDTVIDDYLKPVEGFENPFTDCHILTYHGELNTIKTKKVVVNGKEKHELLNFSYYINLKYNSKELANKLMDASIYISMVNGKLLLEIIETGKKEEIYFINGVNGHTFKSISEAKKYLIKE
jgi:hypothetical protein